jgi:hypothetical protein
MILDLSSLWSHKSKITISECRKHCGATKGRARRARAIYGELAWVASWPRLRAGLAESRAELRAGAELNAAAELRPEAELSAGAELDAGVELSGAERRGGAERRRGAESRGEVASRGAELRAGSVSR